MPCTSDSAWHNLVVKPIRFSRSARRHRIGKRHVWHVMTTSPAAVGISRLTGDVTISWIGDDDRGLELEVVVIEKPDAFITAALDAGVPLRDVQEAASHADPRTTMRYDRNRVSLDRHATYVVAAYVAGAAR